MNRAIGNSDKVLLVPKMKTIEPIQYWGWVGLFIFLLASYFILSWVTGDAFVAVPYGPDEPPAYMKIAFITGQLVTSLCGLACVYYFIVKPWKRDRRLSTDGLLVIGAVLVSPWDPLSTSGQMWVSYNSYLINYGTVLTELPFNLAPHQAGANVAWPILFIPTLYANFVVFAIFINGVMRWAQRKWPSINIFALIAISLFVGICIDILLEVFIVVPLGFWVFGGGHLNIFAGEYYQFPLLNEALFAGAVFAGIACLRYFIDDKGHTFCEKGIDKLSCSPARKQWVRFFAVVGVIHLIFLFVYHIPNYMLSLQSTAYPEAISGRSYFTNRMCGPEVDLACPGPGIPIHRAGAERPNYAGEF